MKLPFDPPDRRFRLYCPHCHKNHVLTRHYPKHDPDFWICSNCGKTTQRVIFLDPRTPWWIDDHREIWHESVGVFVLNDAGKVLLFRRRLWPPKVTIPAGHLETAFTAEENAHKELDEETGLKGVRLKHLGDYDISGDSCIRGADYHRWHVYAGRVKGEPEIMLDHEGKESFWVPVDKALTLDLAPAIRYLFERVQLKAAD
jgi:8-oxo-dGTP pyrophosphatase MutT (NUDIX family)